MPANPTHLRRSSEGTLHFQLYRTLLEMIEAGTYKIGERMPTEAELVDTYGVSRATARRALDELRRQGIVDRKPGRGTFVMHPPMNATLPNMHSVADEIRQLGYKPDVVPLSVDEGAASEKEAQALRIAPGDPVLRVNRLRTADGAPIYLTEVTINLTAFPGIRSADFSDEALYRVLERHSGSALSHATQWLSAVGASRVVSDALEITPDSPVLRLERILYMTGDAPIALIVGHFNGEIYNRYSEAWDVPSDESSAPPRDHPAAR